MKSVIAFDLETTEIPDSGIKDIETIHCIAATNLLTKESYFADETVGFADILTTLSNADIIIAHNAIGFDVPILKNFFPDWKPKGQVFDTLVMCRAIWQDVAVKDFGRCKAGNLPRRLLGSQTLESYGYRLGERKGDFGKQEDAWDVYTPEMAEYCKQDVIVLAKLYERIMATNPSPEMIELENRFAEIMAEQEARGVAFDEKKAVELMFVLRERDEEITKEIQEVFPPMFQPVDGGKVFTALRKNKKMPGLEKSMEYCKIKLNVFNPGSRQQIADRLIKQGWQPSETTEGGAVKVNEVTLKDCDLPAAELINEYLLIKKRLSQLADGYQAWLKKVKNGRIYGRINTGGAISGRCTHSNPNLAQVPSVGSPFGLECRGLFGASIGYTFVGCDASGLELRCLAHYLGAFDGGEYADIVLNGDIHTANQEAAGLPDRNMAKTFIYGWLYGAGVAKIGKIVDGGPKEGASLQKRFMAQFPAIKRLKDNVEKAVESKGFLKGLDGRKMRTRSPHSALNLLLQGAGALVMKRWLIYVMDMVKEQNLQVFPVLNVHDEAQFEVLPEHVEAFTVICHKAFEQTTACFKFRIKLEGEVKVGKTWASTH